MRDVAAIARTVMKDKYGEGNQRPVCLLSPETISMIEGYPDEELRKVVREALSVILCFDRYLLYMDEVSKLVDVLENGAMVCDGHGIEDAIVQSLTEHLQLRMVKV